MYCCASGVQVLLPEQVRKGFTAVFEALEDLKLDVPDVAAIAATFVARAVIDDILPPSFVAKLPSGFKYITPCDYVIGWSQNCLQIQHITQCDVIT